MPTTLHLRLDWNGQKRFGPGKARLLELIAEHGSISAAARAMGMSYRRAWLLTEQLNTMGPFPMVAPRAGGRHGGGADLTPFGRSVLDAYTRILHQAAGLEAVVTLTELLEAPPPRDTAAAC